MPLPVLQFLPLAVFSLGAPVFLVLSYFYWRKRHKGTLLFRIFTLFCAASFVCNLVSGLALADSLTLELCRAVMASVLPPMMLQLVLEKSGSAFPRNVLWRIGIPVLYVAAAGGAVARGTGSIDAIDRSEFLVLGICATLSAATVISSHRNPYERAWMLVLFGGMAVSSGLTAVSENLLFEILPDYLMLLFFAVYLYYSERLAFFDVFLRTMSFVVAGATVLLFGLLVLPGPWKSYNGDWNRLWLGVILLMPVWMAAPFLYRHLGIWIDRAALGRRYSREEAEKSFLLHLQTANSLGEVRESAMRHLERIFNCRVEIDLESGDFQEGPGDLHYTVPPQGMVCLRSRDDQSPFLSDDERLLQSLALILGVLVQNARLRQHREDLAALAGRAELRALRAQIDPHFLFNALNAVASSIATKPEAAEETLTQLAEVFRYTLNRSHKEWVPLSDEIDFIRSYLAVEQARFGAKLHTEIVGDAAAWGVAIPTMIVQPLVENAIKHGTAQITTAGSLTIEIVPGDEILRVTVRDNGPGFPANFSMVQGQGHGLRNVAERLQGYYGDRAALRWENSEVGASVSIEIPSTARKPCAS